MDPVALEARIQQEIEKWNRPFFINSVAGRTVVDAFANVMVCGFMSMRVATRCKGIKLADSISFNPHEGLGVPQ
jgi:hypothetical protein